jgi:hypothetical protein
MEYCYSIAMFTYVEIKSHIILSFAAFSHHITHMATVFDWNTGSIAIPCEYVGKKSRVSYLMLILALSVLVLNITNIKVINYTTPAVTIKFGT